MRAQRELNESQFPLFSQARTLKLALTPTHHPSDLCLPHLKALTATELSALGDVVVTKTFQRGHRIISKGEFGTVFYIVKEGTVLCTDAGSAGQFKDQTLGPGE